MFCTKCGMKLLAEDKFCARCGNAISSGERAYDPAHIEQAAAVQGIQETTAPVSMPREKIWNISTNEPLINISGNESFSMEEEDIEKKEPAHSRMKETAVLHHEAQKRNPNSPANIPESPELAYAGLFSGENSLDSVSKSNLSYEEQVIRADEPQMTYPGKIEKSQNASTASFHETAPKKSKNRYPDSNKKRLSSANGKPVDIDRENKPNPINVKQSRLHPVQSAVSISTSAIEHSMQQPTDQIHSPVSQHPARLNPQEEELLGIFAGPKSDYYLSSWKKQYSMNWAAFFLTIFWMGYRKMFAPMVITAGAFILAGLVIAVTGMYWIAAIAVPFLLAVIGILANRIYLSHAREELDRVHASQGSWAAKNQLVASRGGTAPAGIYITFGVIIGYLLISVLLFTIL
ncbi:DUF2628 domain-containing protein [Metabacillus sp. KIGAM252]|uniref:DUF2628 domain-containing protein n=1 Tax=Metabacillus flavus TaxID=2823519 RepID=A0ABS5LDC6_9BACI|nr:DUF2628 domain-containing protein [Metabacillus flavus]MBS2968742.1 DUF2628 domain-containing protein [Metabacillus flavus]